jgi:putative nucleotidyltransferase with HDIG domain
MGIREQILERIQQAGELPTLPGIVTKLMRVVEDPHASAQQIAQVIEHDPVLTTRILKVANSVAFGSVNPVPSVTQAAARLGLKQIRNITMTLSVIDLLKGSSNLDYTRFWKHCLSVAFAAQIIARHARKFEQERDHIFTAGMLHDIGMLILDQFANDLYQQVGALAHDKDRESYLVEQEVLGIDHAETGALMLEKWNLPACIADSAHYHHVPCDAPESTRPIVQLVHLANFACNNQGIDSGMDVFPTSFSNASWFDTGLSVEDIPVIIQEVNNEVAKSTVMLAVSQNNS